MEPKPSPPYVSGMCMFMRPIELPGERRTAAVLGRLDDVPGKLARLVMVRRHGGDVLPRERLAQLVQLLSVSSGATNTRAI